jgi:biopolymer transport protein ExbD
MNFKLKPPSTDAADLDVTSFMNLMIVLVPVLLLTLTFTQVAVLDIHLPDLTGGTGNSETSESQLIVKIQKSGFKVFYPEDVLIQKIPLTETEEGQQLDFTRLAAVMKEVKKQLADNRKILLLSDPAVNYQSLVSTMDAVRSYDTVISASLVEVELFPEISLGDAK